MTRRLNDNALKLAALASELDRSRYIQELWPSAFEHGGVKVMVRAGFKRQYFSSGEAYKEKVKEAWLVDSTGRRFDLTLEQYERLKV